MESFVSAERLVLRIFLTQKAISDHFLVTMTLLLLEYCSNTKLILDLIFPLPRKGSPDIK